MACRTVGVGPRRTESLPYAVSCLVICLTMVPAGQMQDKLSRLAATLGGFLSARG